MLKYESDKEDSFKLDAYHSESKEDEPEMNIEGSENEDSFLSLFEDEPKPGSTGEDKKNPWKKIAIIVCSVAAVMVSIALIKFFRSRPGTEKEEEKSRSEEEVIEYFFSCANEKDDDGLDSCFPDRDLLTEVDASIANATITVFLSYQEIEYDLSTLKITNKEDMLELVKDEFQIEAEEGNYVTASVHCKNTLDGREADVEFMLLTARISGEWYILEAGGDLSEIEMERSKTPTHGKETTAGDDVTSGNIVINGVAYQFPFQYNDIKSEYTIKEETLTPGEHKSCNVTLNGDKIGVMLGVNNYFDHDISVIDAQVTSVYADDYLISGTKEKFDLILPGGGTWDMTESQIKEIYGEPDYKYGTTEQALNSFLHPLLLRSLVIVCHVCNYLCYARDIYLSHVKTECIIRCIVDITSRIMLIICTAFTVAFFHVFFRFCIPVLRKLQRTFKPLLKRGMQIDAYRIDPGFLQDMIGTAPDYYAGTLRQFKDHIFFCLKYLIMRTVEGSGTV